MKLTITPKQKFTIFTLLLFLAFFSFFRICFFFFFKTHLDQNDFSQILNAFLLGFRFDLRLAVFVSVILYFLSLIPLNLKFKSHFLTAVAFLFFGLINFLYVLDAGYFSYLRSRVNATIIEFLKNPTISLQMVNQSYPVFLLALLILITSIIQIYFFKKFITPFIWKLKNKETKTFRVARHVVLILLFAWGGYGSIKKYPLRWSEAFAGPSSFLSNLSLNPVLYLFDTYSFRKKDYSIEETKKYYSVVSSFLGVDQPNLEKLNFTRSFLGNEEKQKKKINVVLIIMESMAFYKTGLGGSMVNPTPYLDSLSKESLLFDRFYTPSVATARSVFSAITSLPDTSKVQTGSRNPFVVNQHTIMGEIKNYQKFYFLGGSANWGNIRGVLSYNIPNLKIYEEGSYKEKAVDVWGISDLDLFKNAARELSASESESPFFALIQSAGFHRPYTIPENRDDFKVLTEKDISEDLVKKYGFESMAEYNSLRFQDYSLGRFIELAKKEKWYDNTVFLVFGDHGIPHNNAPNVPEWSKSMSNGYHVPFVIHGPKIIGTGVNSKLASSMDVMPTIAGIIGSPYSTNSLGRDLFNPKFDHYRATFSYNWYSPFHITLVDNEFYFEFIPYSKNGRLVKYNEKDNTENVKDKYPEKYKQMEELTLGLYETSKYLLHNNARMY